MPMPPSRTWFAVAAWALLLTLHSQPAAAAPVVFDFEDGEQGWLLISGAQRQETSALGGSFAVFGTDSAKLRLELDLTNIESFTLEQLWLSPVQETINLVTVVVNGTDANGNSMTNRDRDGVSLIGDAANPFPNPDLRSFDISGFEGIGALSIIWNSFVCAPEDPCVERNFIGYVDNISFHAVPEPSSWLLLSLGIAGMVMLRRKLASRA